MLHDVTEQQQVERERREFVANVSHELRTPLTSMNSYIEALEGGAWQDESLAPQFLSVTREETERMIRLVNDLLQLSKWTTSQIKSRKEIIDFNMFINKIINRHEMAIKIQHSYVKFRNKPSLRKSIQIRCTSIRQRYYQRNEIFTAINVSSFMKQNALYNRMTIRIKDNGIGIPINKVDKIFDRFYRVDKARTRKMGGTGLGLRFLKKLSKHNGRIWSKQRRTRNVYLHHTSLRNH